MIWTRVKLSMYVLTVFDHFPPDHAVWWRGGYPDCQASHPGLQQQQPGQASKQCEENSVKFPTKCYDLLILTSQTDFHEQIYVDISK